MKHISDFFPKVMEVIMVDKAEKITGFEPAEFDEPVMCEECTKRHATHTRVTNVEFDMVDHECYCSQCVIDDYNHFNNAINRAVSKL